MKPTLHIVFDGHDLLLWAAPESVRGVRQAPLYTSCEDLARLLSSLFRGWIAPPPMAYTSRPISKLIGDIPVVREGGALAVVPSPVDDSPFPDATEASLPLVYCRGLLLLQLFQAVAAERIPGNDFLRSTAQLLTCAAQIISHGHVLPTLERDEGRWIAVPTATERELLDATPLPESFIPHRETLLNLVIDAFMRRASSTALTRAHAMKQGFHSVHDAWLAALRSDSPIVSMDATSLEAELQTWSAPLTRNPFGAPLEIRLCPPSEPDGSWSFAFAIGGEESCLKTPAGFTVLGQAMALSSTLSLPQISSRAMYNFLHYEAPVLRNGGFLVTLPEGFEQLHVQTVAHVSTPEGVTELTPETQVETTWSLVLVPVHADGSEMSTETIALTPEALQAICDAGDPLIEFRGRWVEIDLKAAREALRHFAKLQPEHQLLGDFIFASFHPEERLTITTPAIQAFLRSFHEPRTTPLEPLSIAGLQAELRPYQRIGVAWLNHLRTWGIGACLADDMGLGKTLQTLAFLLQHPGPHLIVVPVSVIPVWQREIARFTPSLTCYTHHGMSRFVGKAFVQAARKHDVTLMGYGLLYRDYVTLRKVEWQTLILDEAQNIKTPTTQQSQVARALPARHRVALTGTPVENSTRDLWSIIDFLNPGILGSEREFKERYTSPAKLHRVVQPYILRRLKTDREIIRDLPDKVIEDRFCPLTPEQAVAYDRALHHFDEILPATTGIERRGHILAILTRLKQICDHPRLSEIRDLHAVPDVLGDSGKYTELRVLLDQIVTLGESVLIFTQFARMGALLQAKLQQAFPEVVVPFLHGGLTSTQREDAIASFNAAPQSAFFVLSLKAGGLGLTLTKANHVVHYDHWWNPAVENQATDRAHRIGQQKTVLVHRLICHGTLEDKIEAMLTQKQTLADTLVTATPASRLAHLSDNEIHQILVREDADNRLPDEDLPRE